MNEKCLNVQEASKEYPGFSLGPLNFELPAGYIMGLVGPNGAGKSTTISMILDEVKTDSGAISVFGVNNSPFPFNLKERLGVVFDSSFYVEGWTVADVSNALKPFYASWDNNRFDEFSRRFGLGRRKKVKDLSRGMKGKLALAVAFSHDARLLILDEPTSGLDPASRDEFTSLLQEFIQDGDRSVLFSTHITSDLERVADYIVVLNRGSQEYAGTVDQLRDAFALVKGQNMVPDDPRWNMIIGTRVGQGTFEGLVAQENLESFRDFFLEAPTLEEIVTYFGRGVTQ